MNALLGIIGLSLLAFVAAFAIGRMHRPTPGVASSPPIVASSRIYTQPLPSADDASISNVDLAADEKPARTAPDSPPAPATTETDPEVATDAPVRSTPALPAPPEPATPTPAEIAAKRRAEENRVAIAARRAHADQLPDDFQKYYAQELPEDAISPELNVRASVTGAEAEVITLSSPAFNRENKDFVLEQVRSELTELGFKRVTITNSRGFRTSVSL